MQAIHHSTSKAHQSLDEREELLGAVVDANFNLNLLSVWCTWESYEINLGIWNL